MQYIAIGIYRYVCSVHFYLILQDTHVYINGAIMFSSFNS